MTTLDDAVFEAALTAAIRAPSMHNTQPWRFRRRPDGIDVFADDTRRLPVADPTGRAVRLAGGAAVFNLRMAFAVHGITPQVRLRPEPAEPYLLARVTVGPPHSPTQVEKDLYTAIPRRHSNRAPFEPRPVPADVRAEILQIARGEGAWLELLIGPAAAAAVAEIAHSANMVLRRDLRYQAEVDTWTRSQETSVDGVPAVVGGPSPEPQEVLPRGPLVSNQPSPDPAVGLEPLVAILGTPGDLPSDQLTAGQAMQRILLTITKAGLSASLLSQPIEVPSAREQLRIGLGRYGTPQIVLRIGYGQPGRPTPRRPVAEMIISETPATEPVGTETSATEPLGAGPNSGSGESGPTTLSPMVQRP